MRALLVLFSLGVTLTGIVSVSSANQLCEPTCRSGYYCRDGECVSRCNPPCAAGERCTDQGECEAQRTAPLPELSSPGVVRAQPPFIDSSKLRSPYEKSIAGAFLLEFFVGFGVGHFYAGNPNWGLIGLFSNISLVYGIVRTVEDANALSIVMIAVGGLGKLTSFIMVPILVQADNKKKRQLYLQQLQTGTEARFSLERQVQFEQDLPTFFGRGSNTPFASITAGKAVMFPVFSTRF